MEYRNSIYSSSGTIDCEINHPEYGWIPFTADPADTGAEFDVAALYAEMEPHAAPYVPPPDPSPEELLAQERATMSCSRMQGILTLGEEKWGEVLTYRETATWAEKIIIDDSGQWERVSENIEFIGYLVGYSDEQMDDLFRAAMLVKA